MGHESLNWLEVATSAREGIQRRVRAMAKGRELPGGWDAKRRAGRWDNDVEAACAERAVAKALGIYWPESPDPDYAGDLAEGIYVRSTDRPDGCLILYDLDPDDGVFILAVGQTPHFMVAGWLFAREGKAARYESGGRLERPGYLVPQTDLHPMPPKVSPVFVAIDVARLFEAD